MLRKTHEMLSSLRQDIFFIIQNAGLIDYLSYGFVVLCFVFLFFLGIFFALKWWWQIGFLVILADFITIFFAFYYTQNFLSSKLRNISLSPLYTKQLQYSDNLILDLNITNNSKEILQICKIDIGFYVASDSEFKNYANSLNPFVKKTIIIKEPIFPKQTKQINGSVGNFAFIDYNTTIKAECFE